MAVQRARRLRADGERSREQILLAAARLATVEGIDGLSLARLAHEVGMSKSGLFAHFGSKEELQLATIDTASQIFEEVVVRPALQETPGLSRLEALCERFLRHVEDGTFPGGCFFASVAAELDTRPGPVRERAFGVIGGWTELFVVAIRDAQAKGAIDGGEDPEQLAFEIQAYLLNANLQYVMGEGSAALERARRATATRIALARHATDAR